MTNEVKNAVNHIKEYLALNKDIEGDEYIDSLRVMVQALESHRWILVSERLPEFGQVVLLSLRSLDVIIGFRAETEPYFYCYGVDGCYVEPQNVLAWMPSLPQPYIAESDKENEG